MNLELNNAINWMLNNINTNEGIVISDLNRMSYPEVSGYFIPTLLSLGYKDEAISIANWLSKIINQDGSISLGPNKFTFDTAMVMSGLQKFDDFKIQKDISTKYLLSTINQDGTLKTNNHDKFVPIEINLWALVIIQLERNIDFDKIYEYYIHKGFDRSTIMLHFYCYILDALLNTSFKNKSIELIKLLSKEQRCDGSIPAYDNVTWNCYTGIAQAAVLFYNVGLVENGDRAINYLLKHINIDGSFYGSDGPYFPNEKISWAVKFFIDACMAKINYYLNDYWSNLYPDNIDENEPKVQSLIKLFIANINKNSSILDIGCGKGAILKLLKNYGFINIEGCDISDKVLSYVPKNITVKLGSVFNLPYMDKTKHIIIASEVFEHVSFNLDKSIKECYRVLQDDGRLFIIDKNQSYAGVKCQWEEWFDPEVLTNKLLLYFKKVKYHIIDKQFILWECEK